jgi:hypothetical protein
MREPQKPRKKSTEPVTQTSLHIKLKTYVSKSPNIENTSTAQPHAHQ